ncbi:MAG TPA: GNAT family N-acetyltransferase [Candidatus Limiplasma stercoravium]|nr:GNAT family N-acetyltransferase [Candidatus Limiplasma stercoravium]
MLAERYLRTDLTSQEDFEKHFSLNVPPSFHFAYDVVDEYARLQPHKRALIWEGLTGEERTFTFGDISRMSNQAANVFAAQGLRKGDPVVLMLKRRWQYWVAAVALLKVGCVLIPATAQLQKKDIVYRVQASGARALMCVEEPGVLEQVRLSARECPGLCSLFTLGDAEGFLNFDALMQTASPVWKKPADLPRNDDIMLMYFTSGTTGMPKMAAHSWTYPIAQAVTAYYWHNVGDEDVHMAVADTGWAKAGWGKLYGQWMCGATLFVYDFDRFVAADLLRQLEKHRVTSFCAPPTVYRFLIKEDLSRYDLSALRWANCAGEPLNPEVYDQFLRLTGVRIHEGFGQSETTPLLMTSKWMDPKPGSTGRPSPAYDIALVDENGQDVDDGVEGEIVVRLNRGRPAGLFLGYYRNQEQTDAVFYGGVYHTGDMAWRDVDGYYYFIGRSDDVIKSSGYRIGPFEVESALMTHPAVLECAVTAVPHPDRGQVVKATVVLVKNRGYEPTDALKKELQNHVKQVTAPYKYPRIVEFVDELPKTISGKIQRKLIRRIDRDTAASAHVRRVSFEPVTAQNFNEVAALRVSKDQKGFADSPLYSMSQAFALGDGRQPYAIRSDEGVVGFVMFRYGGEGRTEIANLLIDAAHQGLGLGAAAIDRAVETLRGDQRTRAVHLAIAPDNEIARALYENMGFMALGMDAQGRMLLEKAL